MSSFPASPNRRSLPGVPAWAIRPAKAPAARLSSAIDVPDELVVAVFAVNLVVVAEAFDGVVAAAAEDPVRAIRADDHVIARRCR